MCYQKTLYYVLRLNALKLILINLILMEPFVYTSDSTNLTMSTVSIDQGMLKGSKRNTDKGNEYFEFLCIPYAKPPVGNLRFKTPQPPEPWDGVKDATVSCQNHVSSQIDFFKRYYTGTEDCLYLNVFTPKLPTDDDNTELLPVMVYIHEGGFLHGNGVIETEVGPDYLIDNNVVVVTLNYRLGILGFLSLDIPEAAGNMGLKDQVQALTWVQNNINKFGGNKNNVTIFGISAGAASVEYLILSPKAEGLFQKAILQSGSSLNHWAINFKPQILLENLLQYMKFEGSMQNHREIYEYLMSCEPQLLTEASFKVITESNPERVFFGFVPTIEVDFGNGEAFLTSSPYKLFKEGKFNKVPVIKGFTEKEGYLMYVAKPATITELSKTKDFVAYLDYPIKNSDRARLNKKFAKAYNKSGKGITEEDNIIDFYGDYDIISGVWLTSQFMSDQGVNVHLYKFSYDGKINYFKDALNITKKGPSHADDKSYIFKNEFSKLADDADITVRDRMTKLWTNFAKTSDPNWPVPVFEDCLTWSTFSRKSSGHLNIDKKFTMEPSQDKTMVIFKNIYDKYET